MGASELSGSGPGRASAGEQDAPTVIVAEDEAIIRMDLCEFLHENGYRILGETGRGDEALVLAESLRPDIAVLDIEMPGLDGLSAAGEMARRCLCAVVILTAYPDNHPVEGAADAGVDGYVVKPYDERDLLPALKVARSRFADRRRLEEQAGRLQAELETRKLVDRARGLLMDRYGLKEGEAFRFLQSQAMNGRRRMGDVARDVLDGTLAPS